MFDDVAAALSVGPRPSFEDELRRLLDSVTPVTLTAPPAGVCELAEDFRWHRSEPAAHADGAPAEPPTAADDRDPADHPDAGDDGVLPDALVLDAQFAAGVGFLAEVRAAQAAIGREEARRARALAGFARSRPSSLDRSDAEVGAAAAASRAARPAALAGVSEWAVDEVAVALGVTGAAATTVLAESLTLVDALPGTLAALEAGKLTWAHARVMTDLVAPLPGDVRDGAEARLLSRMAGRTPAQLRVAARRVVARLDAEAVRRRVVTAVRERRVALYPGEDCMGTLSTVLPLPVARAVYDALEQYADAAATDGDERTKAERMADCLVDLVLRPGEHGLAPVQARLTVVAAVRTLLGGDEPGEVDGDLVPAAVVRELSVALGLMPPEPSHAEASHAEAPHAEPPHAEPPHAEPSHAEQAHADADDRIAARQAAVADLLDVRRLAGTALAHRPHLALVDELSGALLCLTDAAGLRHAARTGRGLGPPASSPGYRPGEALDRFVRHRDRRCRFPGCRARPIRCDLDRTAPWPHGRTSADNLSCLCRHHHRLSHQAPGWSLRGLPDGGLRWNTPTGQVVTTDPPRYGTDDDLPPDPATDGGRDGRPPPAMPCVVDAEPCAQSRPEDTGVFDEPPF